VPTDFTIALLDEPGTLARASDTLGRAGVNIEGACGYVLPGQGQGRYHVLVSDAEQARRALIDSGFDLLEERDVALVAVEDRPGAGAEILRRIAASGVNVDLLYVSIDGRIVLGGQDIAAIRQALG
jgi:hypothetical protein